MEKTTKKLTS